MPGKTGMTVWYLILAPLVILSALFMGLQIRERIRPSPEEPNPIVEPNPQNTSEPAPRATEKAQREQRRMALAFSQVKVFQPLVTPKPTPTRRPQPTATPTPLPLAKNYRIQNILGSSVILIDYTLKTIIARVGQKIDDPLGAFRIEEVDGKRRRVRVKLLSNGYERWITQWQKPGKGRRR